MILAAIDPGACAGLAVFGAGALLERVDLVRGPGPRIVCDRLVVERPIIRGRKVDANKIATLAARAGELVGASGFGGAVEWVEPYRWKGQLPKDVMGRRILARLTPVELSLWETTADAWPRGLRHNALDAVGIGLWALRRL